MKKIIEKHVLINAEQHGGKATAKAVMNHVLGEVDRKKVNFRTLGKNIDSIIKVISKLTPQERMARLKKIYPDFFKPKEIKAKELPELEGAIKRKVVLRFAPSPSGPLHIGHTYSLLLNYLYKKKYNGKLILRIEDTNPANIYPPAYKQIVENANWLTNNGIDEVHIQSDRMRLYYKYAKELIDSGFAYVCTCDSEKFKDLLKKKQACPCRRMSPKEHKERWEDMFLRYAPGQAALRIKTDLAHKNPAIREWVAFRITSGKHPRQGDRYTVWPLMNFAVAIDDHEMKMTHILHGKDHQDNAKKQSFIYKYFRWKEPKHIYLGRINFKNMRISTSIFRQEINSKVWTGWDDVRLPTVFSFQRRGIQPEAFARLIKEIGPTKVDKTVSYSDFTKTLYKFNKKIIDTDSHRYFFVPNPVKLKIYGAPNIKMINLKLHPHNTTTREVKVSKSVNIPDADFQKYENKEIRLKGLYNIKLKEKGLLGSVASSFSGSELKAKIPKVQWVAGRGIKTSILMPTGKTIRGLAETNINNEKVGSIVQFERFGFCKMEKKTKNQVGFVYTHG